MVFALPAGAVPITFTGAGTSTSGQGIAASAIFEANGSTLTITLANTWLGNGGTKDDAAMLVAVLFSGLNGLSLSGASAFVPAGEQTWLGTTPTTVGAGGLNVGGEWAYKDTGIANAANNFATAGISSAGLSPLFGSANLNGPDLNGNPALDGAGYGLVSANYDSTLANNGLKNVRTVKNSTVFTFYYTGNLENLGNVQFAYGTLPNSYLPGVRTNVPDGGSTIALMGFALLGVGYLRRKIS